MVNRKVVMSYAVFLFVMLLIQVCSEDVANVASWMILLLFILVGGYFLQRFALKLPLWPSQSGFFHLPFWSGIFGGMIIAFAGYNLLGVHMAWQLTGDPFNIVVSCGFALLFSVIFAQVAVTGCFAILTSNRQFSLRVMLLTAIGWLLPWLFIGWLQGNFTVVLAQFVVWAVAFLGEQIVSQQGFAVGVVAAYTMFFLVAPI